jgi:hypothetical protein
MTKPGRRAPKSFRNGTDFRHSFWEDDDTLFEEINGMSRGQAEEEQEKIEALGN